MTKNNYSDLEAFEKWWSTQVFVHIDSEFEQSELLDMATGNGTVALMNLLTGMCVYWEEGDRG